MSRSRSPSRSPSGSPVGLPEYLLTPSPHPMSPLETSPPFGFSPDTSHSLSPGEGGGGGEASPSSPSQSQNEEQIFSLLFGECDTEHTGLVDVKDLIEYIRRMQLQVGRLGSGEDTVDSEDSMDFDLKLLQNMLDCNCDTQNRINESTYTNIIRKWVKTVRERAAYSAPAHTSFEPPDSPALSEEEPNYSYGSYDLDRAQNTSQPSLNVSQEQELNDLVSKYQYEIKRLNEHNRELLMQHEQSEEALREYQGRSETLQTKLEEAQSSLVKLHELESLNVELNKKMMDADKEKDELAWAKERLNRELEKLKAELSAVRCHLSTAESERASAMGEVRAVQQLLIQAKETEREVVNDYESQLSDSKSHLELVNRDLDHAHCANAELKSNIADLEAQLIQLRAVGPFASTPYHPTPSLHEELMGQERFLDNSPMPPLNFEGTPLSGPRREESTRRSMRKEVTVSPAMESLTRLLDETDTKVNHQHHQILRNLSDLMLQPSPSTSHRDSTSIISQGDQSINNVETKLKAVLRKKNQFKNENINLRKENEDLKERLRLLEEQLAQYQPPHLRTSRGTSPLHSPIPSPRPGVFIDPLTGGLDSVLANLSGGSGQHSPAGIGRVSPVSPHLDPTHTVSSPPPIHSSPPPLRSSPPRSRTPGANESGRASPLARSPTPPCHMTPPVPRVRRSSGGNTLGSLGDEEVFEPTTNRVVEDPSLDPNFRAGDYSPKHSSSLKESTGLPTTGGSDVREKPVPVPRRSSKTDEEMLEAVFNALTPSPPLDLSLKHRTTPPSEDSLEEGVSVSNETPPETFVHTSGTQTEPKRVSPNSGQVRSEARTMVTDRVAATTGSALSQSGRPKSSEAGSREHMMSSTSALTTVSVQQTTVHPKITKPPLKQESDTGSLGFSPGVSVAGTGTTTAAAAAPIESTYTSASSLIEHSKETTSLDISVNEHSSPAPRTSTPPSPRAAHPTVPCMQDPPLSSVPTISYSKPGLGGAVPPGAEQTHEVSVRDSSITTSHVGERSLPGGVGGQPPSGAVRSEASGLKQPPSPRARPRSGVGHVDNRPPTTVTAPVPSSSSTSSSESSLYSPPPTTLRSATPPTTTPHLDLAHEVTVSKLEASHMRETTELNVSMASPTTHPAPVAATSHTPLAATGRVTPREEETDGHSPGKSSQYASDKQLYVETTSFNVEISKQGATQYDETDAGQDLGAKMSRLKPSLTNLVSIPRSAQSDKAMQVVSTRTPATSCLYSLYQTVKTAVLTLFFVVLILTFILLLVLSRDAVENCGSHCPHSPIHLIYSTLDPYLHHTRVNPHM